MSNFRIERLCTGALATFLGVILQTGCGGGVGSEPSPETLRTQVQALSATGSASAPAPDLPGYLAPQVIGITKVAERRVSRTVYDYDFVVQLKNGSRALSDVQAVLTGSGVGTTILVPTAQVGEVAASASITSSGKVTIRHDRTQAFSTAALTWAFKGVVTASRDPIVVRAADPAMIRTLSDGQKVVMSQLIVVTDGTQTLSQDVAMLAQLGAEVIGRVPEANFYQVLLPNVLDEDSLVSARNRLGSARHVSSVSFNGISELAVGSDSGRPNDAFIAEQTDVLEPASIPAAWKTIKENFSYLQNENIGKPRLGEVVVGVIDAGFVDSVRDLQIGRKWGPEGVEGLGWGLNPELKDNGRRTHGMHVAGIIAAIGDNGTDSSNKTSQIAGIAWQIRPIVNVARADDSMAVQLSHVAILARSGARIINKSMGRYTPADRTVEARSEASFLKNILRYYDFLLVLAAGNSFDEAILYQPLANIFRPGEWSDFEEVRNRVLIVANADTTKTKTYLNAIKSASWIPPLIESLPIGRRQLWCDNCGPTNYGVGVQIAAPGTSILSLSDENDPSSARPEVSKRVQSGTSMAAPVVAGVAAAAMGVNPSLSAAQVKQLMLDNAGNEISFDESEVPKYFWDAKYLSLPQYRHKLVNMDAVVRAAASMQRSPILDAPIASDLVSVSVACDYPVAASEIGGPAEYRNSDIALQVRVASIGESSVRWLQQGWAAQTLPVELAPGKYVLEVQGGSVGAQWSSTQTVYPVYFDVVEPLLPQAQRLQIRFRAASDAACLAFENMENPSVTADPGVRLLTAGRTLINPFPVTTDSFSWWSFEGVSPWVKRITWIFSEGITRVVELTNNVFDAVMAYFASPGIREVTAILNDGSGSGAQGVTLKTTVYVAQGAVVESLEAAGPVVAGQQTTFWLRGTKLPTGLVVTIDDCGIATERLDGASDTQRPFTCFFPASAVAGPKNVGVGPVGSKGSPFESAVASGLTINLVKSTVTQVSASPTPRAGLASTINVIGTNLPSTAAVLVDDASCDRSTVIAKTDGTGFTQTCTFGPKAGTKMVMVMSSSDVSGFVIDDSKTLTVVASGASAKFIERPDTGSGWNLQLTVTSTDANGNHGTFDFGLGQCTGTLTYEGKDIGGNYMFQENHLTGSCLKTCKIAIAPDASHYNERCTGAGYTGGNISPTNRRWLEPRPTSAELDALLPSAGPTGALSGLWTFNDCTGTDSSGAGRSASISGSTCITGLSGKALEFKNPGFNLYWGSDSVALPAHTAAAVSFSAWVKWGGDATSGDEYAGAIWAMGVHTEPPYLSIWINEGSGKIWTDWFTGSPYKLTPGVWTMLTITSDGNGESLYLNGELIHSALFARPMDFTGQPSYLSRHFWSGGSNAARFRGVIDEARMYSRPLSAAEVKELYSQRPQ